VLTIAVNLGDEAVSYSAPAAPLLFESADGAGDAWAQGRLLESATVALLTPPTVAKA
jgi:hypothetical protein